MCGPDHFRVTQHAEGANDTVDIAAGLAVIAGDIDTAQGDYVQRNDGRVVFNGVPAPPTSGTREHLLYLQISDKQTDTTATDYLPKFLILPDTGAGLRAAPKNALGLAGITRRAGQSAIYQADIRNIAMRVPGQPPAEWCFEFTGGDGQGVDRNSHTRYAPGTISYAAGFPSSGAGALVPAVARIVVPTTCVAFFEAVLRSDIGGASEVYIKRTSTTFGPGRLSAPGVLSGSINANKSLASVSGTLKVRRGDIVECFYYQDAVGRSHLNNSNDDLHFAGHMVRTIPGLAD